MRIVYDGGVSGISYGWDVKAIVTKNGRAITTPVAFDMSQTIKDAKGNRYKSSSASLTYDSGTAKAFPISVTVDKLPERSLTLNGKITVSAHTTQLPVTLRDSASDTISKDVTATEYGMSVKIS